MAVGLLGPLTAERRHPWPQGLRLLAPPLERPYQEASQRTQTCLGRRNKPPSLGVPPPVPQRNERRSVRADTGLEGTQQTASGNLIPAPARSSFFGSPVGATQLRSAKWPAYPGTRKAAAQALHLPSGSRRTPPPPLVTSCRHVYTGEGPAWPSGPWKSLCPPGEGGWALVTSSPGEDPQGTPAGVGQRYSGTHPPAL